MRRTELRQTKLGFAVIGIIYREEKGRLDMSLNRIFQGNERSLGQRQFPVF